MELKFRDATFTRADVDTERRVVKASLSSESPVMRFGEAEVLSHEPGAVDLSRADGPGLPLLWSHDRSAPIGVVERVRLEGRRLVGELRFGSSTRATELWRDVADGILSRVSIGYLPIEVEQQAGGCRVTRWSVFEASLVAVPADNSVGVGRSAAPANLSKKGQSMDVAQSADGAVQGQAGGQQDDAAEIQRAAESARHPEWGRELVARGLTFDQARREILDRLAAADDAVSTRSANGDGTADRGGAVSVVDAMAQALAYRFGGVAPEQGNPYLGVRVVDMARELLTVRGIPAGRLSPAQVIERAHSTSDFPNLLANTGNRVLRAAYQAAPSGVKAIARPATAVDFRAKYLLALGEAPELLKVNEGGEFTRGTMAEGKESYSLSTFGRIFSISRHALVNDELGAFADILRRFAASAIELEAKQLASLLASNPAMDDGVAVFHANHSNLAGTGGALSVATLGAGRSAMRLQKGYGGSTPINATPRFLLVPAALETSAEQLLTTIYAATTATANPFSNRLELVVDPRLDAYSTTAWYLAADPTVVDGIEYSYLESDRGPVVETRAGFDVDGVEVKCRLDFGAGFLDHRGLYKNAGA